MTKALFMLCCLAFASAALAAGSDGAPDGFPAIAKLVKGGGCAPKDNTARILKSANPLDLAPNWTKTNHIGTAWTFMPSRYVKTDIDGGVFLQGDLISTRGAVTDRNVFILFKEWTCGE
jgi:hypothetical protein